MKYIVSLMLAVVFFLPQIVHAETMTWSEDPPKEGWSGYLMCLGDATADSNTYHFIGNIGFDADQPVASEREWQAKSCDTYARTQVVNLFKYHWNTDIDPKDVKVSYYWRK